jgi:glyoxylase-like metal-dependent hydrolase (beta-lactamase superfamily II)
MLYLLNNTYLFTGDAFRISGKTIKPHPFTMDEKQGLQSIRLIDDIRNEDLVIFTAHYGQHSAEGLFR